MGSVWLCFKIDIFGLYKYSEESTCEWQTTNHLYFSCGILCWCLFCYFFEIHWCSFQLWYWVFYLPDSVQSPNIPWNLGNKHVTDSRHTELWHLKNQTKSAYVRYTRRPLHVYPPVKCAVNCLRGNLHEHLVYHHIFWIAPSNTYIYKDIYHNNKKTNNTI